MRNVHKIINYIVISLAILSITGCLEVTNFVKNDSEISAYTNSQSTKKVEELEDGISQLQMDISQKKKESNELKDSTAQEKGEQSNMASTTQKMYPENETIVSLSPNGKYRAEAYGTITRITAGGLFPYEGIRILNVDNDDVIWRVEPGGYTVSFSWSCDSRYVGVYYTSRILGESIVVDIKDKKTISLPALDEITSSYGEDAKPQENRPDPYFEISGWENIETVIVDFHWIKLDGEKFRGQYTFNIKTKTVTCQ